MTRSVAEFNEQLLLNAEAGIPLGLDLSSLAARPADAVKQIELNLQRHGFRENDVTSWQAARDELPRAYVQLVETGLKVGNISEVWKRLRDAEAPSVANATQLSLLRTWIYPVVCGIVTYIGFVILCWYTVPQLQFLAYESEINEGVVLRVLGHLHESLRWWGPVVPALVVGGVAAARRRRSGHAMGRPVLRRRWFTLESRDAIQAARAGQFAAVASLLHRHRLPLAEVLATAAEMTEIPRRSPSSHASSQSPPLDASYPPLLQWTIERYTEDEQWNQLLDAASVSYRRLADQKAQRSRSQRPVMFGLVVGGTFALLYALALFVPLVDLLGQLASSIVSASAR